MKRRCAIVNYIKVQKLKLMQAYSVYALYLQKYNSVYDALI